MKIESHVVLTREERSILNQAWDILDTFYNKSIEVSDSSLKLRDFAHTTSESMSNFIDEYDDTYI